MNQDKSKSSLQVSLRVQVSELSVMRLGQQKREKERGNTTKVLSVACGRRQVNSCREEEVSSKVFSCSEEED